MKIADGKIIEATEDELFSFYLERDWDEIMAFPDFLSRCMESGTVIKQEDAHADHQ